MSAGSTSSDDDASTDSLDLVDEHYRRVRAVPPAAIVAAAPLVRRDPECVMSCKVVLLGNSGVGKTQFMAAAVAPRDAPVPKLDGAGSESTIGIDFRIIYTLVNGIERVKTVIWDTAGQERFASIIGQYVRGANVILLLYDVTDQTSFLNIGSRWIPMIDEHRQDYPDTVVVLVANKVDRVDRRHITPHLGEYCARTNNLDAYLESSVLDRQSVHTVIDRAVGIVYALRKHKPRTDAPTITLGVDKKSRCCDQ